MRGKPFGPGMSLNGFGAGEVSSLKQGTAALRGAREERTAFFDESILGCTL